MQYSHCFARCRRCNEAIANWRFRMRPGSGILKRYSCEGHRSNTRERSGGAAGMIDAVTKPKTKVRTKTERPRLHKVILVNDDFTPREFVVTVLKAEFRMT